MASKTVMLVLANASMVILLMLLAMVAAETSRDAAKIAAIEKALLSQFGMKERPIRRHGRKMPEIPEFMMEQYRR